MDKESFSSFMFGLGIGVAIGILFAPKSGEETRGLIRDKAGEGKEYLKQRGSELREAAGSLIEKGKEAMGRQKENIAEAVEAGKQAYRETVGQPTSTQAAQ